MKKKILLSTLLAIMALTLLAGCGGAVETSQGSAGAGKVSLTWDAPTKNADGTTLTDLAGYRIYYGETSGPPFSNSITILGNTTTATIGDLPYGRTIIFAATAFDVFGNESDYSNTVSAIPTE